MRWWAGAAALDRAIVNARADIVDWEGAATDDLGEEGAKSQAVLDRAQRDRREYLSGLLRARARLLGAG